MEYTCISILNSILELMKIGTQAYATIIKILFLWVTRSSTYKFISLQENRIEENEKANRRRKKRSIR